MNKSIMTVVHAAEVRRNDAVLASALARVIVGRVRRVAAGLGLAIGVAAALLAAAPVVAQTFHVINPGMGTTVNVLGGSQDGSVVVGDYHYSFRAYRWTVGGGLQTLPVVSNAGNDYQIATGVSRDGQVVSGISGLNGFRWTQGTGSTAIGPFGGGGFTDVNGISGNGQVFFGRTTQLFGGSLAYTWTTGGGVVPLPFLGTGNYSTAAAATPTGSVVVGYATPNTTSFVYRGTLWSGGVATDINTGWSTGTAYPLAISDDANTIWGIGDLTSNLSMRHAVRWQKFGPSYIIQDMGIMPGYTSINVGGCSPDGTVQSGGVGNATTNSYPGYVWSTDLGWRDLNAWLPSVGINTAGVFINGAGISADGTAMWGNGRIGNTPVGWVARGIPCQHVPTIFTDPIDQMPLCAGSTATFNVGAAGSMVGNVTYQWQRDDVNLSDGPSGSGSTYSGVNTAFLSVSGVTVADNGLYTCIVSNPCGSVRSGIGELVVEPTPQIVSVPAPGFVCPGGSASFPVGVIGTTFQTTYQWEYYSQTFGVWAPLYDGLFYDFGTNHVMNVSGATTPTLSLGSVYLGEVPVLNLRCYVASPCRALRPVYTTLEPLSAPAFGAQPNDQYYCFGTTATFTASAANATSWNWQIYDPFLGMWLYLNDGYFIDGTTFLAANINGVYTPSMTVNVAQLGSVGSSLQFRLIATGPCGTTISNAGTYTFCRADFNCDGFVDFTDFDDFGGAFDNGEPSSDFNGDGFIDFTDFDEYVAAFEVGC